MGLAERKAGVEAVEGKRVSQDRPCPVMSAFLDWCGCLWGRPTDMGANASAAGALAGEKELTR